MAFNAVIGVNLLVNHLHSVFRVGRDLPVKAKDTGSFKLNYFNLCGESKLRKGCLASLLFIGENYAKLVCKSFRNFWLPPKY